MSAITTSGRTYTTRDLSRRSGDIIAAAFKAPVTLTQRNKPRFVLVTVELFDELMQRADPRKVGKTADMPADLTDKFKSAVEVYVRDETE